MFIIVSSHTAGQFHKWHGKGIRLLSLLKGLAMRYFAAPLRILEEHERREELNASDVVLLRGYYGHVFPARMRMDWTDGRDGGRG